MTDRLGVTWRGGGRADVLVWAPKAQRVELRLMDEVAGGDRSSDGDRLVLLTAREHGYFDGTVEGVRPGARYWFRLDGQRDRPDPASRWQPEGVHGPSAIVEDAFAWTDAGWRGLPLAQAVVYELHVGTFTAEGTFDAAAARLPALAELGITAVELMPVAQCPGARNWGYDGVYPFAAHNTYGGPEGLRRFVDAAHAAGLAVVLDVVYNHLGPEGNYTGEFAPYTTEVYHTPWGGAINFDGADSDHVRRFFLENARQWIRDVHIDGLRLDAIHAIIDRSAKPFLEELTAAVAEEGARAGRLTWCIGEVDVNDARLLRPRDQDGVGLDAQWNDDFHHALHARLTGERAGYYGDFGRTADVATALRDGYVYTGQYSAFRRRRHGRPLHPVQPERLVVYAQNHDQIGNRMRGDRLATLVPFEALKLAAALVLLSPFVPLLFMGEEYGETAPFAYFVSHGDARLIRAVRRGRREEFRSFVWQGRLPDPQAEATFRRARLDWGRRERPAGRRLLALHRRLLAARSQLAALGCLRPAQWRVDADDSAALVTLVREGDAAAAVLVAHFGTAPQAHRLALSAGAWSTWIDTSAAEWRGPAPRPSPAPSEPPSTSTAGLPAELSSGGGDVSVTLAPLSAVLLVRPAA
jgi:maltooligosyltrehalose trehalohydrolase